MAQRAQITVIPMRHPRAELDEALDALDLLDAALQQSIGDGFVTGLQLSALSVARRLRRKHRPAPAKAPSA